MRHVMKPMTPKIGKLRGFSTPPQADPALMRSGSVGPSGSGNGSSFLRSGSVGPGAANVAKHESLNPFAARPAFGGSLSDSLSASTSRGASPGINPDAFKPRASVKKLTMPHRVEADNFGSSVRDSSEAFRSSSQAPSQPSPAASKSKIRWNPAAEFAANSGTTPFSPSQSTSSRPRPPSMSGSKPNVVSPDITPSKPTAPAPSASQSAPGPTDISKLKEGDYWTRPSIAQLQTMSFQELSHLPDFTVGRIGYGEITFLQPVNLTSLKVIADIPGGVVEFTSRCCVVYVDETIKPPPGEGLNVPSRITLEKCWTNDRATGDWIKDASHPRYKRHLRTMRTKENTEFISFDNETGTWIFTVEHFTRYGLDDDDDYDDDDDLSDVAPANRAASPPAADVEFNSPTPSPPRNAFHSSPINRSTASPSRTNNEDIEEDSDEESEASAREPPRPWASQIGLDPRRVHVMQASLFADNEEEAAVPEPATRQFMPKISISKPISDAASQLGGSVRGGQFQGVSSLSHLYIH